MSLNGHTPPRLHSQDNPQSPDVGHGCVVRHPAPVMLRVGLRRGVRLASEMREVCSTRSDRSRIALQTRSEKASVVTVVSSSRAPRNARIHVLTCRKNKGSCSGAE
jgi:hypothetical protein